VSPPTATHDPVTVPGWPPGGPPVRPAAEVTRNITLSRAARKLLGPPEMSAREYFAALLKAELYVDAVRVMAAALPPRCAIWWACLACRHTQGDAPPPDHAAALGAAVHWVLNPTPVHREAAGAAAAKAGPFCPAGCAAKAAFWGGTSDDPDKAPKPVQPAALHRLVGAAVLLACGRGPAKAATNYRQMLMVGVDVFICPHHWCDVPAAPLRG
jgi:hypothetical protein